jgi:hypothetical protein
LKTRPDFPRICGNSDGYGANVDKFVFSKTGHSYLTYLKGNSKPNDHLNFNINNTIENNNEPKTEGKRKLQTILHGQEHSNSTTLLSSPVYKKITSFQMDKLVSHNGIEENNGNTEVTQSFMSPKCYADAVKNKDYMITTAIIPKSQILPSQETSDIIDKDVTPSKSNTTKDKHNNTITQSSTQAQCEQMIPYVDVKTRAITISTMTPEIGKTYDEDRIIQTNMMNQLVTKHIQEDTLAVSHKYDKILSTMQAAHNDQINNLLDKQKAQATEIAKIKESQGSLKTDLELQIHNKVEKQMTVLTSLVEIVQNMQKSDQAFYTRRHQDRSCAENIHTNTENQVSPIPSDPDLSYSDSDDLSVHSPQSVTIHTKTTTPNTVDTDSINDSPKTQDSPIVSDVQEISQTQIMQKITSTLPSDEVRYKISNKPTKNCTHTNNIASDVADDIRNTTLTKGIDPISLEKDKGWKDITDKTKKLLHIEHAIISPNKAVNKKYNKHSPNFNKYDPEGSIVRGSSCEANQSINNVKCKDRSSCRSKTSMESDRDK